MSSIIGPSELYTKTFNKSQKFLSCDNLLAPRPTELHKPLGIFLSNKNLSCQEDELNHPKPESKCIK